MLARILDGLAAGGWPGPDVDPQFGKDAADDVARWRSDMAKLGARRSIHFQKLDALGSNVYDVAYANGTQTWVIFVQPDGKAAAVFPMP